MAKPKGKGTMQGAGRGSTTLRQEVMAVIEARPSLGDVDEFEHVPHRPGLTPLQMVIEDCEGMYIEEVLLAFTNKQLWQKYHLDHTTPNKWRERLGVKGINRAKKGPDRSPEYPIHPQGQLIRRFRSYVEEEWHRRNDPRWPGGGGQPPPGAEEEDEQVALERMEQQGPDSTIREPEVEEVEVIDSQPNRGADPTVAPEYAAYQEARPEEAVTGEEEQEEEEETETQEN